MRGGGANSAGSRERAVELASRCDTSALRAILSTLRGMVDARPSVSINDCHMPEYDLDFATKLAQVAGQVEEKDPWAYDARRVTLYLGRLSAEITLKALLEKAGVPQTKIRRHSHNLRTLLKNLGECEVEVEIHPGERCWVSASRVRAICIDLGFLQMPIGTIIDAEDQGASTYPNQIRYGEQVVDFDPHFVSSTALLLAKWAREHWDVIRYADS
jgi:hypothetical protein